MPCQLTDKNTTPVHLLASSTRTASIWTHGSAQSARKYRTETAVRSCESTSWRCSGEVTVCRLGRDMVGLEGVLVLRVGDERSGTRGGGYDGARGELVTARSCAWALGRGCAVVWVCQISRPRAIRLRHCMQARSPSARLIHVRAPLARRRRVFSRHIVCVCKAMPSQVLSPVACLAPTTQTDA